MATALYLRRASEGTVRCRFDTGTNDAKADTTTSAWNSYAAETTRGTTLDAISQNTVSGPTSGVELPGPTALPLVWYSPPIAAGVTVSSTVSFNVWGAENNMSANVCPQFIVERVGPTGSIISTVINSQNGTNELPVTTRAAQAWTASPTSTTFAVGDRIRIRLLGNDSNASMGSGFTFTYAISGASAGADGDTYVSFTETITFDSDPAGSTLYPTTTASDIDPNGVSYDAKEAWTSRGSGATTAVTNTAGGWTAPLLMTTTAGGNYVEWFTKPLQALTLAGSVLVNLRLAEGTISEAMGRTEIAVTANDGTSPTVWGSNQSTTVLGGSELAHQCWVSGPSTSVTNGQRLRIRCYIDDAAGTMNSATTVTMWYAGTSGGASGDTYMTLAQSVAEYVAGASTRVNVIVAGF